MSYISECCGAAIDVDIPICQRCKEWSEPIEGEEEETN